MKKIEDKKQIKKAIILAGGLGTRFLPATLCLAKELFPIGDKPILMYHLKDLLNAGIDDILIIGNKLKEDSFKNFLNPSQDYLNKIYEDGKASMLEEYYNLLKNLKITYVNQDDQSFELNGMIYPNEGYGKRGSAIAILAGKYWTNGEPFVVLNGDDLCFYKDGKSVTKEVVDVFMQNNRLVVYGKEVDRNLIWKYSSMALGKQSLDGKSCEVLDIVEKPQRGTEPSNIMGFCRYVLDEKFFDNIFNVKPRGNGEYNMTDVLQILAQQGYMSTCIFGGDYFDCGSMGGYALANLYVAHNSESTKQAIKDGVEKLF